MKQKKKNLLITAAAMVILATGCQKELKKFDRNSETKSGEGALCISKQAKDYSSDVAFAWMNMQLQLMKTATGIPNVAFTRHYAYSGIALYESIVPGIPIFRSLQGQLNGLSGLPQIDRRLAYHWPSSANAALAFINKHLFSTTSAANQVTIDSLENALNLQYQGEAAAETINRSIAFGKAVAQKVFDWAETDGYLHASDAYTPPAGPGLWVPTPPALAAASTPYWGNLRIMVSGSGDDAQPGAPTPYSPDPSSDFYKMVKQVYDVSQTLTPEQTAMALYWRDIPGVTTPGHYLSILKQVLQKEKSPLNVAGLGWALSGITVYDAAVCCWQTKYHYNLVRPITYIRTVLGNTTWSSLLTTPAHPEYSSAHAVLSAANADIMTVIFGDNYNFTDTTYNYLGMAPRSFSSFRSIGIDAGNSRLYAGIHYQPSINTGLVQGRKVAKNIIRKLKFLKE